MKATINLKPDGAAAAIKYAVIYARYSSSSQQEQSIDGQLRICNEYAARMGYKVINEYVDRAKTGTNTNRPAFQNMIADSSKGQFQAVIVYMVDRFARSKEDSVVYKATLRRNGVKVLSATEQIGDTDEGYLVEGLLEMFAEQYSTKLSKRVKNGLVETRAKGNFTGGYSLIGFKSIPAAVTHGRGTDHKVVIDEEKAPIIRYAFEAYANGVPKKKIIDEMNRRGWRTNKGNKFTINSLGAALRNRKYIGEYYFNGEKVDGYPVLIDPAVFERVQQRLDANKHAPATQKAEVEYILYGKAYCGHCGANMVGVSGTSKTGARHHYYACAVKYKHHTCNKKNENKEQLEAFIVENVRDYITIKSSAERIADLVLAEYSRFLHSGTVKEFEAQIKGIDKQIEDIVDLLASGSVTNAAVIKKLDEKANDLTLQKEAIEAELAKLRLAIAIPHTKADIIGYLSAFAAGSIDDPDYRRRIIDRLINTIFVYDDKVLVYFNILDDRHITFDMLPDLPQGDFGEDPPPDGDSCAASGVRILSATPRQSASNKNPAYLVFESGRLGLLILK